MFLQILQIFLESLYLELSEFKYKYFSLKLNLIRPQQKLFALNEFFSYKIEKLKNNLLQSN